MIASVITAGDVVRGTIDVGRGSGNLRMAGARSFDLEAGDVSHAVHRWDGSSGHAEGG